MKMFKKILILALFFAIQTDVLIGKRAIKHVEPNMPVNILDCNSISMIEPYLSSKDEITRKWAIRRLGQLDVKEAVHELVTVFDREPRKKGMEIDPLVRMEIIHTLGKIGTEQARNSLLSILKKYLDEGPIAKRYAWQDSEYMQIMLSTLGELGKWKDKSTSNILNTVFLNDKITWRIREKAYEQNLDLMMQEAEITGLQNEMNFLLAMLKNRGSGDTSDWVKGKDGVKTFDAIKNGAITKKLISYEGAALTYIEKEIGKTSMALNGRRRKALSYIKKKIEISIKQKKQTKKHNI